MQRRYELEVAMGTQETALIVIDSGFSMEAIRRVKRVVAVIDLTNDRTVIGEPHVKLEELEAFAGDTLHHGTIVLEKLAERLPDAPYILIRAFGHDNRCVRTEWLDGRISRRGWTEAYRDAVELCRARGLRSVANCSFGGFIHAMDGTGWEAFQLAHETGIGKPNHIVVAAAGRGDGRASHASWLQMRNDTVTVHAYQENDTKYNFWGLHDQVPATDRAWRLKVLRDGNVIQEIDGGRVPGNLWNGRQQETFWVPGSGHIQLMLERHNPGGATEDGAGVQRFDVWVATEGSAVFFDHVDETLISEPACLPQVIAVGLHVGKYAPNQSEPDAKPECFVHGRGQISFHTPRVTAAVARLLSATVADLDVGQVRKLLGKYPQV